MLPDPAASRLGNGTTSTDSIGRDAEPDEDLLHEAPARERRLEKVRAHKGGKPEQLGLTQWARPRLTRIKLPAMSRIHRSIFITTLPRMLD